MSGGQQSLEGVVRPLSWVLFGVGLLVSLVMTAALLEELLVLLLAGVFPALLGYAGLVWTGALPWAGSGTGTRTGTAEARDDEELVEELKRRYAKGELSDAEMEHKVETILNADDDGGFSTSTARERETEFGRL